jgi:hypothetical protein
MTIWFGVQLTLTVFYFRHFSSATAIVFLVYGTVIGCLWKFKSRAAAITLLLLLLYSLIYALSHWPRAAMLIVGIAGPFVWFAARAVEATFKIHGRFANPAPDQTA